MTEGLGVPGGRLVRYDARTATNGLKLVLAAWSDRIIAALILVASFAGARAVMSELPGTMTSLAAGIGGGSFGFVCARAVHARIRFHSTDGPLAADALTSRSRLVYALSWHGVGVSSLAVLTMLWDIRLPPYAIGAYAVAASIAHGLSASTVPDAFRRLAPGPALRATYSWSRHPRTGAYAGAALIALFAGFGPLLPADGMRFAAGIAAAGLAMALTTVDHDVVRFMSLAGLSPVKTAWLHLRNVAVFGAMSASICAIIFGSAIGVVVGSVAMVGLLFGLLRVLAYRSHRKRLADFMLLVLAGLLVQVALSMPVLLPVVLAAIFWRMHERARAGTWMIE